MGLKKGYNRLSSTTKEHFMGTRNLTAIMLNGAYKVAQYGQWDGYPDAAGVTILEALVKAKEDDFAVLRKAVEHSSFIDEENLSVRWNSVGADGSGFVSMDIAEKFKNKWPQLDRDMGYNIVGFLLEHPEGVELNNSINFVADSLFCEYAYVVDLDKNTFEVYRGFNKKPLEDNERFAAFFSKESNSHRSGDDVYHPVRLWKSFDLDNLPNPEEFMEHFSDPEEDDDMGDDLSSSSLGM